MKRSEEGTIETRIPGRKYLLRWTCKGCDQYKHSEPKRHNRIFKGDQVEAQAALIKLLRPVSAEDTKLTRTFAEYCDNE